MTRRPVFWIVFGALGVAGAITAIRLFTVALPVVSLQIDMDRERAISAAAEMAERFGWGGDRARSAASFGQVDPEVQTYVELEGGGRGAFQALTDAGAYQPYQWRVRRFAEGEVEEVEVRFSPGGDPYGFRLRLAEDDPGSANLGAEEARALAEGASDDWAVDLAPYALIESSEERLPGGRVDHTNVYERTDLSIADARFRLRLVVSGDRLSELTHFVFVPEAFTQRYADMRATNDTIALVSQSFFILVYILLGAVVGTAILLRQRWIEWRAALAWGAVTALLFGLNTLNTLPLSWMGYDTALSSSTFVLQNVAAAGAIFVLGTPLLAFFFLAGESLGRKAFPEHLQQWRFWSPAVAASRPALGLTVAAYLLVGLQVGYVVLFYLGTSRLEGWWSPADALVQPDLLASYQPWLQAVSISLFASLWEESIFRAVPIACAALVGARYGRRGAWIWAAVVIQAVVFAAGHANYPQQPPYARVVELTLPALVWGVVYVRFGLVPTILAHFLYDLSLISSVLFASNAFVDQLVIVAVGAVPLAVVLRARRGGRASAEAPEWAFNGAWKPPERDGREEAGPSRGPEPGVDPEGAALGPRLALPSFAAPVAALAGLALWGGSVALEEAPVRLEVSRGEAIDAARAALRERGFDPAAWAAGAYTGTGRGPAHEYVFQEAGPEAFEEQIAEFLAPPQWIVRFVDWDAEPAERVEEFVVNVLADGGIRRVAHTLPEGRPGAVLEEDSARVLAVAALPPGDWEEVGADETTHELRTDWEFTYREGSVLTGVAGEARASVTVLGEEVADVRRFVEVPEEWEREQREVGSRRSMVSLGLLFTLFLVFGAAAVVAIVVWSRRELETGPLWKAGALAAAGMSLSLALAWPVTEAVFTTAQPREFQVGGALVGLVLVTVVVAASIALVVALAHSWAGRRGGAADRPALLGVAVGLLLAGLRAASAALSGGMPSLPEYAGAGYYVPALAAPIDAIVPFLLVTSSVLALAVAHRRWAGSVGLRSLTTFVILALGFVVVPEGFQDSLVAWVTVGATGALVVRGLVHVVASVPAVAPAAFATSAALGLLEAMRAGAYPGSTLGAGLAVLVVAALGWGWSKELSRRPAP